MAVSARTRAREKEEAYAETHTFLDLNQLELALINRALRGNAARLPDFVQIGRTKRILLIQRENLEMLCRKLGKEHRNAELEGHLMMLLSGRKLASVRCFAPKSESGLMKPRR